MPAPDSYNLEVVTNFLQLGLTIKPGLREILSTHSWDRLPPFLASRSDFKPVPAGAPADANLVADYCFDEGTSTVLPRKPLYVKPQRPPGGGITWCAATFGEGSSFPWFNTCVVKTLLQLGVRTRILWWPPESINYRVALPRVVEPADIDDTVAIINTRWMPPGKVVELCSKRAATFMGYFQAEATRVQLGLASWMNGTFDAMLATSTETKKALELSGLKIPCHVFGHGIFPDQFPFIERPVDRPYTFIHFADVQPRKGTDLVIAAFRALKRPDIRLYIKALWKNPEYGNYIKQCGGDPRITWDTTSYPPHKLKDLLAQMDCGVFPSRGEGFGLPKLECEATGLPTISTRFGGYIDTSLEEASLLIDVARLIPAQVDKGKQAEPDLEHLIELMTQCANNPSWAKERGRLASQNAHAHWKWTDKVQELLVVLQNYGLVQTV